MSREYPEDGVFPVETEADRAAVYKLRYEIYVKEMGRYGSIADHVAGMLIERATKSAVSITPFMMGSWWVRCVTPGAQMLPSRTG